MENLIFCTNSRKSFENFFSANDYAIKIIEADKTDYVTEKNIH